MGAGPAPASSAEATERVLLERDLYLGLLNLNSTTDLPSFLRQALELMLRIAGASQGYLEVFDESEEPDWWTAAGCSESEVERIRAVVSRGIIAEALATGRAVVTPSALLDPRFRDRGSVQRSRIEAVLCAPIGSDPPVGVLYLQGRTEPGMFTEEDLARAEMFGRHLAPLVHQVFDRQRQQHESDFTREVRQRLRAEELVGHSQALARLLGEVALAAPLDVSVLLTGETGTGKTQLARVIHANSPRRDRPLVELNCATIPEPLMESELFGAMPGAHSTASRRMEGKVAAADGGTLVLDEIAELSVSAQAKLLQLMQTREYYPLGASKSTIADVRIIAATNVDLRSAVDERRFREDLYYRLQVLPIRVPSLSERREDIEQLAGHFVTQACQTHKLRHVELSLGALRAIRSAPWRGNIRELAHVAEAAAIRAVGQGATQVEASHLFGQRADATVEEAPGSTFQEETRRFQEQLLRENLEATGWNIAATARRLDLTRSHVYNLIKSFGLSRRHDA